MNKFFSYILGILFSPNKTLQELSEDKRSKDYILILFVILVMIGLFNGLILPEQQAINALPINIFLKNLSDTLNNFLFIISPLTWFIDTFFLYATLSFFSNKREFMKLLITLGFISIIIATFGSLISYLSPSLPQIKILSYIGLLWAIYLEVIAVSYIYSLSKTKVLLASIIRFIMLAVLFVLGVTILYIKTST